MLNGKTVALELKRIDICDLMLACTVLDTETPEENQKWAKLHDKLKIILDKFDEAQEDIE